MIDLKKTSGLPLKYDERKYELFFNNKKLKPDIRKLSQIKDVCHSKVSNLTRDKNLYYMYRDVSKTNKMEEESLRYDVTVIPPNMIGDEFVKTAGHYHPDEAPHVSYPELYEVLYGEAHILIEEINKENEVVKNYLIIAKKGDKVLIPPNYGHITINTRDTPLVMANIVEAKFKSNYEPIKRRHGASYYIIQKSSKGSSPVIVKNHNYNKVPLLKEFVPKPFKKFGIEKNTPMFTEARKYPEKFLYLVKPHKYLKLFKEYFKG